MDAFFLIRGLATQIFGKRERSIYPLLILRQDEDKKTKEIIILLLDLH